jgi:hypothetical protein
MNIKLYRVTEPMDPNEDIDTANGRLKAIEWLRSERTRWFRKDLYAEIRTQDGKVALYGQVSGYTPGWHDDANEEVMCDE